METLKQTIKNLSSDQTFLKDQRKTVKIVGERKVQPWEATMKHASNREKLRILFAAYGLMKGKTFNQIENHYPEETHPLKQYQSQIDKIILQYAETVCSSE